LVNPFKDFLESLKGFLFASQKTKEVRMLSKLYIGNLSFLVNEQELRELFTQAGGVEDVKIITDQFSGRSRGFGFVQMASTEEAQKAIGMFHGHSLKERALVVAEARPQRQPGGRGDGGWKRY